MQHNLNFYSRWMKVSILKPLLVFSLLATSIVFLQQSYHKTIDVTSTESTRVLELAPEPKTDLPVLYLSDKDKTWSAAEKKVIAKNIRVSLNLSFETVEERNEIVSKTMEPAKLKDDFRFCLKEVPMEGPFNYTKKSKNPCWYDNKGKLRCVPHFFVIGASKSGTTDVYQRIVKHPQVTFHHNKEKHWLDYARYYKGKDSVTYYTTLFNEFTEMVEKGIKQNGKSRLVVGDGTPCYFFSSFYWPCYEGNRGLSEPKYTNPDVIYRMNPKAKIILSLRDPVKRLFSRYLFKLQKTSNKSRSFHQMVNTSVAEYTACIEAWSPRHCAYNGTIYALTASRLQEGMYPIYLQDWLKVFPREQLFIYKFEDYVKDERGYLKKMMDFLELDPLPARDLQLIASGHVINKSWKSKTIMLPETEKILQTFYAPYNKQLQSLLGSSKWSWGYE